ncbi:MAG: hypothetical protein WKF84_19660 [Pyrinomonadaceae bacterium]
MNIYDVLYHEKLVLSRAAVEDINRTLDPTKKASDDGANEVDEEEAV